MNEKKKRMRKHRYPAAFNNYDVYMYAKLKNSDVWLPLQGQPQHMIEFE